MNRKSNAAVIAALAGLCAAAGAVNAQVVINEVYTNPPGSSSVDPRWEYIEIYGSPGMSLTGYAIAVLMGGSDLDGNGVPGPLSLNGQSLSSPDEVPEIDEAFTLDGLTIGTNGVLVLYNNTGSSSFIPGLCPPQSNPLHPTVASFTSAHLPSSDVAGKLNNDGSATFVLVRKRPFHAVNASGVSVYDGVPASTIISPNYPAGNRYSWRKDVDPDVNFDGKVDLNGIGTMVVGGTAVPSETPINSEAAATPAIPGPHTMEPYQMVDDLGWSNLGGVEYTRSKQQEISDTPGFNPDAAARVAYYGANPMRGGRLSNGVVVDTHMADEEWVYGDIIDSPPLVTFDPVLSGGPTDPAGPLYNDQGQLDPSGTHRLDDINRHGFKMTPGAPNDVDATAAGGIVTTEFRFVRGDFNFDGVVDCADRELILSAFSTGATLDDTEIKVRENGTPEITDDVQYTGWKWQGRDFNGLLAMIRMDLADGTTGEWNSGTHVTMADVAAFDAVLTASCCQPDIGVQGGLPGHDGALNNNDFIVFISHFFNQNPIADMGIQGGLPGHDGHFDNNDFIAFISLFFTGCN